MRSVVYGRLGASRREVLVGPRFGVDNAVVRVAPGRVLVVTADPLSYIPTLGAADSAWLSVNLIASDLATSGFAPEFGIFDFNLPPKMTAREFTDYWKHFHEECNKLGIAIIRGHTGRYDGCDYTIIGGGVMYAIGDESQYLTSGMARPGDDIVLTKGAAIETTAVLASAFPRTVRRAIGASLYAKARAYLRKVSTVNDSLTAVSVGVHQQGVTAMHDATEGGVIAGAFELSNASGLGAELDLPSIAVSPETEEICKLFRINPLNSLSEGALLIACRPTRTCALLVKLRGAGIGSYTIGRFTKNRVFCGIDSKGIKRRIRYPRFDPYWRAYSNAMRNHWK